MFAARCAGVSLAVFVVLYLVCSLLVSRGWRLAARVLGPQSASGSADLLFVLRILPLAMSAMVTAIFTLPSFLLLEPRSTNEAIGTVPVGLGICCLLLLAAGIVRASMAQRRASRALRKWLDGSTMLESGNAVPIFRTVSEAPSFTVAGVCAPKVLVSEAAMAMLSPRELRSALRHEIAHAVRYDNLKKLLFRFSVFPAMAELERAWAEETEMAADDAAVSNFHDALDLAAALIKVSRLMPVTPVAELTTALLHSSTALSARVKRLVAWDRANPPRPPQKWRFTLVAAVIMLAVIPNYSSVLAHMHAVTEWLVR